MAAATRLWPANRPSAQPTLPCSKHGVPQNPDSSQTTHSSDLVDIDILPVITAAVAILVELDIIIPALVTVGVRLVDLGALGQLSVCLEAPGLVGAVFEYDVALFVLVVAQREEDDVAVVDPDFLAEFALQDKKLVARF